MTCIRLDNGQTLHSYCKEKKLPYHLIWGRIDKGVSLEEAIKPPYNIKTKYYIDGVPAYRKLPYTDYLRWWRLNATVENKK